MIGRPELADDGAAKPSRFEGINRGCSDRPLSNAEIESKYFDNACRLLTRERAERVRDAVVGIDRGSVPTLGDVLAQAAE